MRREERRGRKIGEWKRKGETQKGRKKIKKGRRRRKANRKGGTEKMRTWKKEA